MLFVQSEPKMTESNECPHTGMTNHIKRNVLKCTGEKKSNAESI